MVKTAPMAQAGGCGAVTACGLGAVARRPAAGWWLKRCPVSTVSTVSSWGVHWAKRQGGGSPRWCSNDEVAVHSLAAVVHRR
jgi:hypothetical protein